VGRQGMSWGEVKSTPPQGGGQRGGCEKDDGQGLKGFRCLSEHLTNEKLGTIDRGGRKLKRENSKSIRSGVGFAKAPAIQNIIGSDTLKLQGSRPGTLL